MAQLQLKFTRNLRWIIKFSWANYLKCFHLLVVCCPQVMVFAEIDRLNANTFMINFNWIKKINEIFFSILWRTCCLCLFGKRFDSSILGFFLVSESDWTCRMRPQTYRFDKLEFADISSSEKCMIFLSPTVKIWMNYPLYAWLSKTSWNSLRSLCSPGNHKKVGNNYKQFFNYFTDL